MSSNPDEAVLPTSNAPDDVVLGTSTMTRKRAASKSKTTSSAKRAKHGSAEDATSPEESPTLLDMAGENDNLPATVSRAGSLSEGPLSEETLPDNPASPVGSLQVSEGAHESPASSTPASPPSAVSNTHPHFADLKYAPYTVLERLATFAQKVDDVNNRFAVSCIPRAATWGSTSSTDKIYCNANRPITYWLVGIVGSKWFTNFKGEPQLRVNIGLRLPYKDDDAMAKNIYKLARPVRKDEDIPDLVYASKYMGKHVRGNPDAIAMPFKDVYDAQKRFRSKREMSIIPPAYISKGDVVLVEAFLTRWNMAKDKKAKAEWKQWDVGFELQAVSLLFEAPPSVDENEYGPAENIRDDM